MLTHRIMAELQGSCFGSKGLTRAGLSPAVKHSETSAQETQL